MMAEMNVGRAGGNSTAASDSLFQGKQFWLSQNVPQRRHFKNVIQENGGVVRLFEKDADIKLVDHVRKNLPADTYSYRFVEDSVRQGRLETLENYRAGPSAPRPVGATHIPARGMKTGYTIQEDQFLWDWMQPYEKEPGAPVGGNRLYQEIALVNSAHTWQSYRDRYLKRLRGRPRPGGMAQPPASSATETGQRGQNQMPASDVALAEPDPSSSRQGSPQRPISTIPSFDRKRKRSDSDGSSTGGDIPPQKRMTTRNPESNQESSTPEVQQGPLPRKIVTLKYGRNNPRTLDIDKGKAPEKAPQNQAWTASQIGPQRIPQRPSQRSPRTSPQQATQTIPQIAFQEYPQKSQRAPENLPQINPSSPQRSSEKAPSKPPQPQESPRGSPQQSSPLALRNAHQNAPQTSPQQILQKSPHKTPQKPPEKPSDPTPKKQQSPPRPFNEVYEPEPIDPMFLELPFLPPSPGASEPEEQPEQDIDAWIDSHLQKGLAKSEDQIIEALRCTSMDPHLADQVLKHLVAGKDIPTDIAGVWTADDDRCIEGRDTRDIERVLEKHGSDYFNSRWQYLDMARTAGLEEVQEGITEL